MRVCRTCGNQVADDDYLSPQGECADCRAFRDFHQTHPMNLTALDKEASANHEANLSRFDLPYSQYACPRIYIAPPVDGEISLVLMSGLPCCGVDVAIECSAEMPVRKIASIIEKFMAFREELRNDEFAVCELPNPVEASSAA